METDALTHQSSVGDCGWVVGSKHLSNIVELSVLWIYIHIGNFMYCGSACLYSLCKRHRESTNHPTYHSHLWLSVENISNTFLILSCTPFWPQNSLGAWILQGDKSVPQGCWPMLIPMFPTVVSSWLYVLGWWTILDTHRKLLSVKNTAASQFLTHSNRCAWHLLPYPIQRQVHILSCPYTLWMAHIYNPCLNCPKA